MPHPAVPCNVPPCVSGNSRKPSAAMPANAADACQTRADFVRAILLGRGLCWQGEPTR
jgi:hypothetical protein